MFHWKKKLKISISFPSFTTFCKSLGHPSEKDIKEDFDDGYEDFGIYIGNNILIYFESNI